MNTMVTSVATNFQKHERYVDIKWLNNLYMQYCG